MKKIRNFLRAFVLDIISYNSKPSNAIHILNGHFVSELNDTNQSKVFEDFIQNAMRRYDFISLEDAIYKLQNNIQIKTPSLVLTFDDGFEECFYIIFPILKKYNISATFFINPYSINLTDNHLKKSFINENLRIKFDKNFLTWEMLIEMSKNNQIIGSHTFSHKILKNLTKEELQKEIIHSRDLIESKLNTKCKYFAFPFGNENYYDDNSFNLANEVYEYTFTSENYKFYFDKKSIKTLSRRHFEPYWNFKHILYFTSIPRIFNNISK